MFKFKDKEEKNKVLLSNYRLLKEQLYEVENNFDNLEKKFNLLLDDYNNMYENYCDSRKENRTMIEEIEGYKDENIKHKTELNIRDAKIRILENKNEYLEKVISELRELPDLHSMIKNLETLTTPNLNRLTQLLKDSNSDEKMSKRIEKIEKEVEENQIALQAFKAYRNMNGDFVGRL